jgi:hypothetical protein
LASAAVAPGAADAVHPCSATFIHVKHTGKYFMLQID